MIGIFEAIGYVAAGFVPTLVVLEVLWRIGRRLQPVMEVAAK